MKKVEALMFDCDGVIAETERDGHRVSFNKIFEQEKIDAYWDEEEYGELVKISGGKERMAAFFSKNPQKYPPEKFTKEYIANLHKLKTAVFMDICKDLPARPGVRRLMMEAHENGLHVFVCSTSNEKSVETIAKSVLGDSKEKVITKIYAGDIVEAKKPAPDIYLLPLKDYNLDPNRCIVFEDTENGLRAACAAGIKCVVTKSIYSENENFEGASAVVGCLEDEPDKPDYISLAEVEELLKKDSLI